MRSGSLISLLFTTMISLAQESKIDSLRLSLRNAPEDSAKAVMLTDLSALHRKISNYDSAIYYAREALALTERKVIYKKARAKAFISLGNAFSMQGNWPESLTNYFAGLKIMEETGEKKGIATCYGNIGNIYYYQTNYTEALKNHFLALKIKQELGDKKGLAFTYNNIANVYTNQSNYREAEKNFTEALRIIDEEGVQATDVATRAVALQGLGNIFYYEEKYEFALQKYWETLKLHESVGNRLGISNSMINLGGTYLKLGKQKQALEFALKGREIGQEIGSLEMLKEASEALYQVAEASGDLIKALAYYKDFISYRDSLMNEENTKATVRAQMNYEFEKKEAATRLEQEKKEAIAEAEKRKQRIILLAISGFGLLVLCFAIFAYRSFLQKKKANLEISRQKELIEEKQKEILDSIHYAKRIQTALLPHEKYVQRNLKRLQDKS